MLVCPLLLPLSSFHADERSLGYRILFKYSYVCVESSGEMSGQKEKDKG